MPKDSNSQSAWGRTASSSLGALSLTNVAVASPIRPSAWPRLTDWLNDAMPWPRTSLPMYSASSQPASREYWGSRAGHLRCGLDRQPVQDKTDTKKTTWNGKTPGQNG